MDGRANRAQTGTNTGKYSANTGRRGPAKHQNRYTASLCAPCRACGSAMFFLCRGASGGVFFFFFAGLDAMRFSEKISEIFFGINVRHDIASVLIILGAWG